MSNKSIQRAGANSNQVQVETVHQHFGLSEKRVAEIIDERCSQTLSRCVLESRLVAEQRVNDFKSEIMRVLFQNPSLLHALEEPSCVDSLERAALTAAKSSESNDRKLLSELLGRRFEEPTNRHIATGVNKAIEVVDLITCEELNGVTVYFAVSQYLPTSGIIREGLTVLDRLYGMLPIHNLPAGDAWIDSLDIHDILRTSQFSRLNKYADIYFSALNGYTVWGIKKGTEEFEEAVHNLSEAGIPADILIDHELHDGYARLAIRNREAIDELSVIKKGSALQESVPLNEEQMAAIAEVFDKTNVPKHEQEMKRMFIEKLDTHPNITAVRKWWDSIPSGFRITVAGKALANANARRINPALPDLEF